MIHPVIVKMNKITKHFPGVAANTDINIEVQAGEIHALLGENGAGKSTLMSILTGLYKPDSGEIFIKEKKVNFKSPKDAIFAGIGMVHQHFRLVSPLTVTENIILGSQSTSFWLDKKKIDKEIKALSEKYGLAVDPQAKIWQLSVGEQQRVEIIKILYRGSDILILDEPTAVLTPQESKDLFATLRRMADVGKAIIVITHKMQEVMDAADRVTVLRGGKSVATLEKAKTTREKLAHMMVGHDISFNKNRRLSVSGSSIINLENIRALNDKGLPGLQDISLHINSGEILGVAGVAGNGQRELVEVITGLRPTTRGKILINEKDFTAASPEKFIEAGISHVPEDRLGMGLVPNLSTVDNIILKQFRRQEGWLINYKPLRAKAKNIIEQFDVRTTSIDAPVKLMSGGNLQKLLLAREISTDPRLIVAVYPVRGLDIGATEAIRSLLLKQKATGTGILLISEDLDEILTLSDRIIVLFEGKIMAEKLPDSTTKESLGLLMTGTQPLQEGIA